MKKLLSLIRVELDRIIRDWKLYAGMVGFLIMCFIVKKDHSTSGALDGINVMLITSNTVFLLVIFAALPSSCIFCDDWEEGFYKFIINRSSPGKYIVSKVAVCIICTFLVSFLSFSVFGLTEYMINGSGSDGFYPGAVLYNLVNSNMNILYIFIRAALLSLVICVYSQFGLACSAIFPNKFVSIASPLISAIIINELSDNYRINNVSLHAIMAAGKIFNEGIPAYLSAAGIIIGLSLVADLIFAWSVRRRIQCEIN